MRIECSSWPVGEASHQKPHTKEPVSIRVAATLSAALGQRLKRLAPRPKRRAPSTRTYRVAWHVDGTVSAVRKTASASVTLYISQTCRLAVVATRRDVQGPTVTRMNVVLPLPAAQQEIQLATGSSHWLVRGKVSSR